MRVKPFTHSKLSVGSGGCGSRNLETRDGEVTIKMEQKLGPLHGLRPEPLGRRDLFSPETLGTEKKLNFKKKSSSQIRRPNGCKKTSEECSAQNVLPTSILPDSLNTRLKEKLTKLEVSNAYSKCQSCGILLDNSEKHPFICFKCRKMRYPLSSYATLEELQDHLITCIHTV